MFENPYLFLRWIGILSAIGLIIYRFELLKLIFGLFTSRKNSKADNLQEKLDELLNKRKNNS